jgi:hypothetical protein
VVFIGPISRRKCPLICCYYVIRLKGHMPQETKQTILFLLSSGGASLSMSLMMLNWTMSPMARAAHCSTVFSFNLQCPDHNRFTTHAGGIRTCGLHPCSFVRACCPHGAVREADCSYAWPTGFIAAHTRDEIEIGRRVISETRDPGFDLDVLYGDQHFCQTKSDALERVRHHIIMCTAPINSNIGI